LTATRSGKESDGGVCALVRRHLVTIIAKGCPIQRGIKTEGRYGIEKRAREGATEAFVLGRRE